MKIFILIDQLYKHGGIEKLVSIKANYWSEVFGYEVIIVSTEQQDKDFIYHISPKVKHIDLAVNYAEGISFFHPSNLRKLSANTFKLQRLIKEQRPDFILMASHIPLTYILPFIRKRSRIIKEFHFSKSSQAFTTKEKIFTYIEGLYDYLVVLSREEQQFYRSSNTVVIPNPVLFVKNNPLPVLQRSKTAVAVLRFAPVKQIEKMVEAWSLFVKKFPDWKLKIFGTTGNHYYQMIKTQVEKIEFPGSIIFCGHSSSTSDEIEKARALLLTSANECFPMVILESFAVGTPVVSFDSPTGPRNIITHGKDGIIVPLNDTQTFSDALSKLEEDDILLNNLSLNAINTAKDYELDKIMNIWKTKIFEQLQHHV